MIEKYESENSMMKYQIIFLKFQNFLYKVDKIVKRKTAVNQVLLMNKIKKKTLITKLKPKTKILGAKKAKFLFRKLKNIIKEHKLKR